MSVTAAVLLVLLKVQVSGSCDAEGTLLICRSFPSHYIPGFSTLIMYVTDVGNLNTTVFNSSSLSSVTRFRMDHGGITGIQEGAFGSFRNLVNISLSSNSLTRIDPAWFGRPALLSDLSLSDNQVEAATESMFAGFTGLTKLSLNKNRIRTLAPNSFFSQTKLVELDLSENRMQRLPPLVFSHLRSARIRLDGNPWDCSCDAQNSVSSIKDLQEKSLLDRETEVTCAGPPALRGQPVWDVAPCVTSFTPGSSATKTSGTKSTDQFTTTSTTVVGPTAVTSALTSTTVSAKTGNCPTSRPTTDSTTVRTILSVLIAVIVVLCVLLLVVCVLVLQHRRKHNNKAVTPGPATEDTSQQDGASSYHECPPDLSNNGALVMSQSRLFYGVRAKSADAILVSSSCPAVGHVEVILQDETKNQADGGDEDTGGETVERKGRQTEGSNDVMQENSSPLQADTGIADTVTYLSIGTNPENIDEKSPTTDGLGQRSGKGKVMQRISTWPLTAAQWQRRCKEKEKEEERSEEETSPDEGEKEEIVKPQREASNHDGTNNISRHNLSSKLDHMTASSRATRTKANIERDDFTTARWTSQKSPTDGVKATDKSAQKMKGQRREQGRAELSENRSVNSKAPSSGGASPDDRTLLSGNEYAFMDLLHEVVQNRGRWTRERWRQMHSNQQKR